MADDDVAASLIVMCMEQNARDAAFTTNALLAYEQRRARQLAEAVIQLREAIEVSAEVFSTPVLDRVYDLTYGAELSARRALTEEQAHG